MARLRLTSKGLSSSYAASLESVPLTAGSYQQRWSFASVYCSKEKVLFLHGGFGRRSLHSDTRFLSVSSHSASIRSLCGPSAACPGPRASHSAVYVPGKGSGGGSQVYTFGGETWVDHSIVFFNEVHRLDLATMVWEAVDCHGDAPSPRCKCFAFEYGGALFVYGGYDGANVYNDLHRLDLKTRRWEQVRTAGQRPEGMARLMPATPENSGRYSAPAGAKLGNKVVIAAEEYEKAGCAIHVLYLRAMRWVRSLGTSPRCALTVAAASLPMHIPFDPPARYYAGLVVSSRHGQMLLLGGEEKQGLYSSGRGDGASPSASERLIWQVPVPRSLDWPRERLLWLACYKNSRLECHLARCPPHVIYKV